MSPRRVLLLSLFTVLAACSGGREPVDVRPTSVSPMPGAFDVSRRVEVRTALDHDLDPASCTSANCWIEIPGQGRIGSDVRYDAATRVLTIAPQAALQPLTSHRVQLTRGLRTRNGSPFATASTWDFTTGNKPVWDPSQPLGEGTLLASRASRNRGLMMVWQKPNKTVHFTVLDSSSTSSAYQDLSVYLGINDVVEAAVADDADGNTLVIARNITGSLFAIRRWPSEQFQPPQVIDTMVDEILDLDFNSNTGLLAVRKTGVELLRSWVFGVGWLPPFVLPDTVPRVHVDDLGQGTAVCGFHRFTPFVEQLTWCRRFCVDPNGNVAPCDPEPATPQTFVRANETAFGEAGRIVSAQTVDVTASGAPATVTRLFEYTAAGGWDLLPILLGERPEANAIAVGPGDATAMVTIAEGLRPIVSARAKQTFASVLLGSSAEPAPPQPSAAVVIDSRLVTGVLWTAAVDATPDAPVLLRAAALPIATPADIELVVDGPFPASSPVTGLATFATAPGRAIAVWSRDGVIRFSTMW